jgi:NAD(P)H-dependent FMN reductase
MHIVLIGGSHRQNSETGRVADYLAGQLAKNHGATTDIMKLDGNPLPLWDETMWQAGSDLATRFAPYADRLAAADGLVVIMPEYAGMAAPAIKNFMLYTNQSTVGHKPALLVAVSAGRGGSYPIAEMRASSYKNNKICYIPEHLLIQGVGNVFKGDAPVGKDDEFIRGRADFALNILVRYTGALATVRAAGDVFDAKYPYGM